MTLDSPSEKFYISNLIKIHSLGLVFFNYGYTPRLKKWLLANASKYDVIIIEGLWQFHSFATWRTLTKLKIPYYVFVHGMLSPWFKLNYPIKHLKKLIYWQLIERKVLRDAKTVFFTSEEERILARQSFKDYLCTEKVVGYGISNPVGNPIYLKNLFLEQYPILSKKRIILFLGRLHPVKGCDLLIEAFANVANTDFNLHLLMVGPDQSLWAEALKTRAEKLGISQKITWTGMLEGDLKWGAFHAAEVFCLPSHQENFGIVVAEALACKKPVLISNKVNIWRQIKLEKAGFIDNDSLEGILRNLKNWLSLTPPELNEMKKRALFCFESHFHVKTTAASLIEILRTSL